MRGENAAVRPAVRPRQRRCWIVRRWTWVSRRRWQPTAAYRYATYMPFWNRRVMRDISKNYSEPAGAERAISDNLCLSWLQTAFDLCSATLMTEILASRSFICPIKLPAAERQEIGLRPMMTSAPVRRANGCRPRDHFIAETSPLRNPACSRPGSCNRTDAGCFRRRPLRHSPAARAGSAGTPTTARSRCPGRSP